MKILVISNLYPPDILGGYEMGCQQAVDRLRARGHEVCVLTTVPRAKAVPTEPHVARHLKLADVYDQYSMGKATATGRSVRNCEALGVQAFNVHVLGQVIEQFQPDVAYAWNLIGLGGLGLLAAIQHMGVPWVMHLMDAVPSKLCSLSLNADPVPALADAFARIGRGRFLCCSRITLDEIVSAGVRIAERTVIIPNWIITGGTPERTDYRPDGHLRLMYAGGFGTHKGTDIIIRAAELLRDRGHKNFSVDLYGMGSEATFRAMIQSSCLDMVHIRGYRTQVELNRLYPNYDVFLFPTWKREPFAFAPMEAMSHGCLAIMSRVCGNAEWFIDGLECIKIERSAEALADAINRILQGQIALEEIGRRAARSVLHWFHISRILPRIEEELTAAVRSGRDPRRPASEAYRIALLAEKTFQGLIHETTAA
jgi:glycosyltransferase involved in cell wall biosynthesis